MSVCNTTFRPNPARYAATLCGMIRCKTISEPGFADENEFAAYKRYLTERFPLLFSACEQLPVEGALFLRWRGKTDKPPLVLMSHSDVVHADAENWKYPPFEGVIAEGRIWGRGAGDTKSSLAAMLEAAESLLAENYMPARDVYFLSSFSEEIAGDGVPNAVSYIKEKGIAPWLVLDEGGAIVKSPVPGLQHDLAAMGMVERSSVRLLLQAKAGNKHTAMENLSLFIINEKDPYLGKRSILPEVRELLRVVTPHLPLPLRLALQHLDTLEPALLQLLPMLGSDIKAVLGPTVRYIPTHADRLKDAKPGTATAVAVISANATDNIDASVQLFTAFAEKKGLLVTELSRRMAPPAVPFDSEGFRIIGDLSEKVFGDVLPVPYPIVGNTDARHFVGFAENVIRMSPVRMSVGQVGTFHEKNENVDFDALPNAVVFCRELIQSL